MKISGFPGPLGTLNLIYISGLYLAEKHAWLTKQGVSLQCAIVETAAPNVHVTIICLKCHVHVINVHVKCMLNFNCNNTFQSDKLKGIHKTLNECGLSNIWLTQGANTQHPRYNATRYNAISDITLFFLGSQSILKTYLWGSAVMRKSSIFAHIMVF